MIGLSDTEINTVRKTFTQLDDLLQLPPPDSKKKIGSITYNFESDLISDGDASYKVYFNLVVQEISQL